MSKIRFFALGGLGDSGKNLYVLDINEKLIILDSGLQHPSGDLLGVDALVPDISYLESRKKDIIGIFLSHAHDKNIGALPKLLQSFKKPVYATNYTAEMAKDLLKENEMNPNDFDFKIVDFNKAIKFKDFKIEYVQTTHSVPLSAAIVVYTQDGAIVYATDYTFDQNVGQYFKTDFQKLARVADTGVLAFLGESNGAIHIGHSSTDGNLKRSIRSVFKKAKHRILVNMYSTAVSTIQMVVNEAVLANKKLAIIGRKAQRLVFIAEQMGYIQIPEESLVNLKFIDQNNKNEFDDVVFLVTGERHEPFFMLQRMAKGYDRLVNLIETDTILAMAPPVIGTEKIAAKTFNILSEIGCEVVKIDKNYLSQFHAASEDIKLMYALLKPKYIIPINGEYRMLNAQVNIAREYGYKDDSILLLDNGEVITFTDGQVEKHHDMVENGTVMVDGNFESDLNAIVLKERELLSQDGFLIVTANVDANEKVMLNKAEIVSRGYLFMKDNEEIVKQIQIIYELETKKQFSKRKIDWKEYKDNLRHQIERYLIQTTKRKPIIIPVIIDTSKDHVCRIL
ncbi:ribonuclease J [Hujiaoplasma nucleasis]|uniref:Ribonuclease J n=1 Tax=Hujiaoplasma nucleasis TaxID=2725268 RepID=A0A7L6N090_9MOLU|nr:ribonuclease J [Hujiaoplasma nucleasis]QLY39670.1 ribonuclease J [Hujiaoplasma nucleasis]